MLLNACCEFRPFSSHAAVRHLPDDVLRLASTAPQVRQVHARLVVSGGPRLPQFLAARLVGMYSGLSLLRDARKVFDEYPVSEKSSLLLWNSILRGYASNGDYAETLRLFLEMKKGGFWGDGFTFPLVIRACGAMGGERLCKIVHCAAVEMGLGESFHVVNELMGMYSKLGEMRVSRRLFDGMGVRSRLSWNILISGFARNADCDGAWEIFERMESEGIEPNVITWTSLLSSHARCGRHAETVELFGLMRMRGVGPNGEILAMVLSACSCVVENRTGEAMHGLVVKDGLEGYLIVKNSLICMYGRRGLVQDTRRLYSEIEIKNVVTANALITSYGESGCCDEALEVFSQLGNMDGCSVIRPNLITWSAVIDACTSAGRWADAQELFRRMQLANVLPNVVTVSTVLSVCADSASLNLGREIHCHVTRAEMNRNVLVVNSLINMYMRCGSLREGTLVFEKFDDRDLISWNTIIAGYGMHGMGRDSLQYFDRMVQSGIHPDGVTFVAVLSACSHSGLVEEGRTLYGRMKGDFQIVPKVEHYACMVDLLGRSGNLTEAIETVNSMSMVPNERVWGALLNACRMHKNTELAASTAEYVLRRESAGTGSYALMSNIYAESGRWEESAEVRSWAKEKGMRKLPGQSWINVREKVWMFGSGSSVESGLEGVFGVVEELAVHMESEEEYAAADAAPPPPL
ncbi:hypothetical protein MLD38_028946 [Melastoma candidum]|uniref:Uncharacterized protein n=1 Tax=Melastoma candidum TaxID=119954 RepID=A0ACB9N2A5_9MYRT|nr:hypothetical protein MLD38_028946 [Melastoma candidum]